MYIRDTIAAIATRHRVKAGSGVQISGWEALTVAAKSLSPRRRHRLANGAGIHRTLRPYP